MYLLDTNVIFDFCNNKLPSKTNFLFSNIEPTISVITKIKLFASSKITPNEKRILEEFVYISKVFDTLNNDIIKNTIAIRQLYKIKLPDAIIAATAIVNDLTLVTHNISDFKNIPNLNILDPYSV